MQSAIRITTKVLAGNKLEIQVPPGLMHGWPETGFFPEYFVEASRFGQKPGFFGRSAHVNQKPGFFQNTLLCLADSAKNPVSLVKVIRSQIQSIFASSADQNQVQCLL